MTDTSKSDAYEECERAVAAAACEERAARAALDEGLTPSDRDWTPEAQMDYDTRLDRWRVASHALADALKRFAARSENVRA